MRKNLSQDELGGSESSSKRLNSIASEVRSSSQKMMDAWGKALKAIRAAPGADDAIGCELRRT